MRHDTDPKDDPYGETELVRSQAETLIEELSFLRDVASDALLTRYLESLTELGERCLRSPGEERVRIEGP
jgi:hypothetical protein